MKNNDLQKLLSSALDNFTIYLELNIYTGTHIIRGFDFDMFLIGSSIKLLFDKNTLETKYNYPNFKITSINWLKNELPTIGWLKSTTQINEFHSVTFQTAKCFNYNLIYQDINAFLKLYAEFINDYSVSELFEPNKAF